ncbi:polyketide cyclase [Mycolicibacterium setense]|uniref:SRPBCC family protein n=1 Tax=Mycolicibacterium setense TaxID=431269 RepID=UPI0007EBA6F9|nr:SRPBCC family protein [Mycolicibacterium setense]OBB17229.1 polyketide cyclase [Mycolicibacterium setense]
MRYRDQPTVEVTQVVPCDTDVAWRYVTDIELPVRNSAELKHVEWLDGADHIEVGARFRGYNRHDAFGEWQTVCEVAEVEPGRRWTWNVHGAEGITATWGFEVEPSSQGAIVRQWARMGPGPSGLTPAILAMPEKEGRIVARRLEEWQQNMRTSLAWLAEQLGAKESS